MRVRVLYFGVLKELFGRGSEMLELVEGSDVATLLAVYRERGRGPASLWGSLAVAVNQEYARVEYLLKEGDEVALLPPVSGGGFLTQSWRSRQNAGVLRLRLTTFAQGQNDASLSSAGMDGFV